MGCTHRLSAGISVGVLIASPALALFTGGAARADSSDALVSIGPVTVGGYTETLTYETDTGAFDNILVGSYDGYPYDLDLYGGASGSNDLELLLTVPLLFQGGFDDVGGTITPVSSVDPAAFVSPDIGLVNLGGAVAPAEGVVSFGPFILGGGTDAVSVNSDTFALDNYFVGTSSGLPYDLDFTTGAPGTGTSELLLTVPALFQVGFDDVAGALSPIFSINAADFVNPDIGLTAIGGL
jgi:hypothetical protein